ncbi:MAG: MBL fold metallo-hydrolase [Candidatus Bathyarchaeia archaeon]
MAVNAMVSRRGAILLGKSVACDAFDENRPLRIVTHAHADHVAGLKSSMRNCESVLMTAATRDLIAVMHNTVNLANGPIKTLDYSETMQYGDERITLIKADHILGAAQVLVEDSNSNRIVYTGDFRLEGTPVLDCDTLVMEATYGNPAFKRPFKTDVKQLLVSMVERQLREGSVYVFGFYGKLQEVMQILYDADVNVPFVMPERVFQVSKVCEQHGMRLGCLTPSTSKEGKMLLEENLPCVAFYHINARSKVGLTNPRLCISGWEFHSPVRQIGKKEHLIALSDHSDFEDLIEYVRRSKPKCVITDNYRVSYGEVLAREIRKRLGINAVAMPLINGT